MFAGSTTVLSSAAPRCGGGRVCLKGAGTGGVAAVLLALLLVSVALATTVIRFPEDFRQVRVGGVVALYAPQAACPVIEVPMAFTEVEKVFAGLLGVAPNLTDPKVSFYVANTLRVAAEAAGGRVYAVGVLSHSPPAGFVVASPLNVTEFARRAGAVKAVVVVLPWDIPEVSDTRIEVRLLQELKKHPEWGRAEAYLQSARLEKARAFRSWLMGNDSALSVMDLEELRKAVRSSRGELDGEALRRAVKRNVENRIGKPVEKASDEELVEVLPYYVWTPMLTTASAGVRDTFFGIPSVSFDVIKGSNMTAEGVSEALLNAVKVLNCTPVVIYHGEVDTPLFRYDVGIVADLQGEQATNPASGAGAPWLPIAVAVAAALAVVYTLSDRK